MNLCSKLVFFYLSLHFTMLHFTIMSHAQTFTVSEDLRTKYYEEEFERVNDDLTSFFDQVEKGEIKADLIIGSHQPFVKSFLEYFKDLSKIKNGEETQFAIPELVNFYSIGNNQFMLKMVWPNKENATGINSIADFVVDLSTDKIKYGLPLDYRTRYWKKETIGTVTYYFRDDINKARANVFNQKNLEFAKKFNLDPQVLTVYMVDQYQEFLDLTGLRYYPEDNGKCRDGYGVDQGLIFAIDNNEDFSHDLLHLYMGLKYDYLDRNRTAEEGMAYDLGNAYYTDAAGEMIELDFLIEELKTYIKKNSEVDLLKLYTSDEKIFKYIAPEISVQRTISGIFYREIERRKGFDSAVDYVLSGRTQRLKGVFLKIEEHLGINKENFNEQLKMLVGF